MKRVLTFSLIAMLVLTTASFAAVAPKKVFTLSSPTATERVANPTPATYGLLTPKVVGAPGKMAVGCWGPFAALKYHFTENFTGTLGGNYSTWAGGSSTSLLGKFDYNLAPADRVQPSVGGYINTTSVAGASTTTFGLTWGVATMVQSNLALGADIIIFNSTSAGGGSTTGILPGAVITAGFYL